MTTLALMPAPTDAMIARLGPIIYRRPDDLIAYRRNARQHPESQLAALSASIREFGFTMPVLLDTNDEIVAGHARVEVARRLKLPEIPTICADHLSPAQVRAYRHVDNRLAELASWDMDILALELEEIVALEEIGIGALGWSTGEIDAMLSGDLDQMAADPADTVPEPPSNPVARPGDLWLLGKHRLLCGSALEPASWRRLAVNSQARMIFTDPPYNVPVAGHISGLGKPQHAEFAMASGEMSRSGFTAFLCDFLRATLPHVADGAVIDVCMDWRHLRELLDALDANRLSLLNLCVWNKAKGGMGSLYRSKHEIVLIAKKGDAPHTNNVELGKNGRSRTNVWDYAGANGFGKDRMRDLADHPTVKPVALVADAIRDVTLHGDIVLDAFMGSGTTLLAAEQTRRVAFGTEIEPRYIDVAVRRWQEMTGASATLEGDGRSWGDIAAERLNPGDSAVDNAAASPA